MKIKHQVIAGVVLITVAAIGLTALGISQSARSIASDNVVKQVQQSLISQRNLSKDSLERYLSFIRNQVVNLSSSPAIREVSSLLRNAFFDYPLQLGEELDETALKAYYRSEFDTRYQQKNAGKSSGPDALYAQLSDNSRYLQNDFIARNPNPLGEKNNFNGAMNGTEYDELHQTIHPYLSEFQREFGYYDVFIVEPDNGYVIYTVFKELDFATSLLTGPYKDSGLAKAFKAALPLAHGEAAFTDFEPYVPSYHDAASFISSPIYSGTNLVGVLIFQMPVDEINSIMTKGGKWLDSGYGTTGESYLVGSDQLLRSQSRALSENTQTFIERMKTLGSDDTTLEELAVSGNAIGLISSRTSADSAALNGQEGITEVTDYLGNEVLAAYTYVDFLGSRWGLISKVNKDEAYESLTLLLSSMLKATLIIALLLGGAFLAAGFWMAMRITGPIETFTGQVRKLAQSRDLRASFHDSGTSEFSELGAALNGLFMQIREFLGSLETTVYALNMSSDSLNKTTAETRQRITRQAEEVSSAATATTEVSVSVQDVSQNAELAAEKIRHTLRRVRDSDAVSTEVRQGINELSANMSQVLTRMQQLEAESQGIGDVLEVIRTIADQTNLLALNAAIEAARAGEQGRGFAVVADEVRTLAQRTAESTEDIRNKIQSLQSCVNDVQQSTSASQQATEKSLEKVTAAAELMREISTLTDEVGGMSERIAVAADQQSSVTREIDKNVNEVRDLSNEVLGTSADIEKASQSLSQIADEIQEQLKVFQFK